MPGKKDKLVKLHQEREDIEMLLSSLQEAYNEASISEEHYNEVRGKNQKKLDEIMGEISKLEEEVSKSAPAEKPKKEKKVKEEKPAKPKKEKKVKEEKPKKKKGEVDEDLPIIPVSQPGPGEGLEGGLDAITPSHVSEEATVSPHITEKISNDVAAVGTNIDTSDIKSILTKLVNEIRPAGIEVLPEVEKLKLQLEKLKIFIDLVKEEKEGQVDSIRRVMEEMGELRSGIGTLDGRLADVSMKTDDLMDIIGALKPERFSKIITDLDSEIKTNDAKIEKIDEVASVLIKRVGLIESILQEIGSIEKVVEFSREIAKRMIRIDDTEKRIKRVGDKVDGIFMELNKRLETFMLYKAKQDTSDELIQEMMKSMDDINTRTQNFITKEDLGKVEDKLESRMNAIAEAAASAATYREEDVGESEQLIKYREKRDEINSILDMMEEQYKSGALSKKEYEKAKEVNLKRLEELAMKAAQTTPGTGDAPAGYKGPLKEGEEAKEAEPAPETPAKPPEKPEASETKPEQPPAEAPKEEPKEGKPPEAPAEKPPEAKPADSKPAEEKPPEAKPADSKPAEKPAGTEAAGAAPAAKPGGPEAPAGAAPKKELSSKDKALMELEDSFKKGLISKEAYEKTKELLGG